MAETLRVYQNLISNLINAQVDLDSNDIKVMLVSSAYVPDIYSHTYKSDIYGEISGENYVSGGISLSGKNFSLSNQLGTFSADDIVWRELTASDIRYGIIYDNTPEEESQKSLIAYIDFNQSFSADNDDLEIVWSSNGILTISSE